eukprot:scaffold2019_cov316-Prasinococcus_capsulatus_cf.AAC.5
MERQLYSQFQTEEELASKELCSLERLRIQPPDEADDFLPYIGRLSGGWRAWEPTQRVRAGGGSPRQGVTAEQLFGYCGSEQSKEGQGAGAAGECDVPELGPPLRVGIGRDSSSQGAGRYPIEHDRSCARVVPEDSGEENDSRLWSYMESGGWLGEIIDPKYSSIATLPVRKYRHLSKKCRKKMTMATAAASSGRVGAEGDWWRVRARCATWSEWVGFGCA